ncbi:MAG: ribonuclease HI [bacterium]|nr:ribonuclease HI [bacterium]
MERLIDKAQALADALADEFLSANAARRMDELLDLAFDILEGDEGQRPTAEPVAQAPSTPPASRPQARQSPLQGKGDFRVYSDGSCEGNPGPGGWGCIVEQGGVEQEYSGGAKQTTNNLMEMTAALQGLRQTPKGAVVEVITDSQYLVKGMSQWLAGWKKKNWKKADGNPVLNRELWEALDQAASERKVRWTWVKGHAGHAENERCDELARLAVPR